MNENRNVGDLLKACRLRASMTQEEMAKHLHMTRSTVSRLENDEIQASYSVVRQWCAYTNGIDLMTMDMSGGIEGWKKLMKLEDAMRQMKVSLESVHLRKEGVPHVTGTKRSSIGVIFSRIRS